MSLGVAFIAAFISSVAVYVFASIGSPSFTVFGAASPQTFVVLLITFFVSFAGTEFILVRWFSGGKSNIIIVSGINTLLVAVIVYILNATNLIIIAQTSNYSLIAIVVFLVSLGALAILPQKQQAELVKPY